MTKQGYELKTETWLDLTADYGQQRRWKQYWLKINYENYKEVLALVAL